MNSKEDLARYSNMLYSEGHELKNLAIKPGAEVILYEQASIKFREAASILETLMKDEDDHLNKIQFQALHYYYLHEESDCLYNRCLIESQFEMAQEKVNQALEDISSALEIIERGLNNVNGDMGELLHKWKTDWLLREIITKALTHEPNAKIKFRNFDFIGALDEYKSILDQYLIAVNYCEHNMIDQSVKRITIGNYFGMSTMVAQMYVGNILNLRQIESPNTDLTIDLLRHLLEVYQLSREAFKANPEWSDYRKGQDIIKQNIEEIISANKSHWDEYVIEFENNPELAKIMKSQDMEKYQKLKAKNDIENSTLKKLYFTGLFWILLFALVVYVVSSIFNSTILNIYKPVAIVSIVLIYSVVGAFILRTNQELSEEGFLKLMKLTFKINIKGLRVLSNDEHKVGES